IGMVLDLLSQLFQHVQAIRSRTVQRPHILETGIYVNGQIRNVVEEMYLFRCQSRFWLINQVMPRVHTNEFYLVERIEVVQERITDHRHPSVCRTIDEHIGIGLSGSTLLPRFPSQEEWRRAGNIENIYLLVKNMLLDLVNTW